MLRDKKSGGNGDGFAAEESSFSSLLDRASIDDDPVVKEAMDLAKNIVREVSKIASLVVGETLETVKPHIEKYRPEHMSQAEIAKEKIRSDSEKHKAELEFQAKMRQLEIEFMKANAELSLKAVNEKMKIIDKVLMTPLEKMKMRENIRKEALERTTDLMRNRFGFISNAKKQLAKFYADLEVENHMRKLEEEQQRYIHNIRGLLSSDLLTSSPAKLARPKTNLLQILDNDEEE